tara:strand:+ start:77 stop:1150 length:1074 start_codon:yes stop_codon:yes gene_type:complete
MRRNTTLFFRKIINSSIIVIISTFISLLLAEMTVSVVSPQDLSGSWSIIHDTGLLLNKAEGSTKHQHKKMSINYNFNKFHAREVGTYDERKEKRVLILGDSFSFGWLLKDEDTYGYKLAKNYPEWNWINASTPAWGLSEYTKYTSLFCKKINPDHILVFVNNDDFRRSVISNLYSLVQGQLVIKNPHLSSRQSVKRFLNSLSIYQFLIENSHFFQLLRKVVHSPNNFFNAFNADSASSEKEVSSEEISSAIELNKALFLRLIFLGKECGSEIKVVYIGTKDFFDNSQKQNLNSYVFRNLIETSFFEENSIQFIDLTQSPSMVEYRKDNSHKIPFDGHPSALGAEKIFRAVISRLVDY